MTSRERVLAHLAGQPVDRLPVMPITMMFACARTGRSYRDYCTDFRVLTEGQMRVAEEFGFDYVNTMSDPAREAADCGAPVRFFDNQPAAFDEQRALLRDATALATLRMPDPLGGGRMTNGIEAVARLKERVGRDLMVEGWVEGPIAEGADLRGINALMLDFYDDPGFLRDLFEFVVALELRFAREQIAAGADVIGIGDAVASLISPEFYSEFVWPFEKKLVDGIHAMGGRTRLHICGDTRQHLARMGELGCHIIDLDSLSPLADARQQMGEAQVLLGNTNPVVVLRNGTPGQVTRVVGQCHADAGSRFIVGAGCEVPPDTPNDNLRALVAYGHEHRP